MRIIVFGIVVSVIGVSFMWKDWMAKRERIRVLESALIEVDEMLNDLNAKLTLARQERAIPVRVFPIKFVGIHLITGKQWEDTLLNYSLSDSGKVCASGWLSIGSEIYIDEMGWFKVVAHQSKNGIEICSPSPVNSQIRAVWIKKNRGREKGSANQPCLKERR